MTDAFDWIQARLEGLDRRWRLWRDAPPRARPSQDEKIFNIGFHRTGTRSFTVYMESLGFRAKHWPVVVDGVSYRDTVFPYRDSRRRVVDHLYPLFDRWDAFADVPFPALYDDLDRLYPNAKFVLVTRDLDDWWESLVRHWRLERKGARNIGMYEYIQYNRYASPAIRRVSIDDGPLLKGLHATHVDAVRAYFAGQSDRFLEVALEDPEIGAKIAAFVGKPADVPYPHRGESVAPEDEIDDDS